MFRRLGGRRLIGVLTAGLAAGALAGCNVTGEGSGPPTVTTDIGRIVVDGGGATVSPKLKVPAPFSTQETTRKVLTAGNGPALALGQRVTVDYLGVNGADGKEFDSSWERRTRATFILDPKQNLPGFVRGLTGVTVGSRILLTIPPQDGYGVKGQSAVGIGPTDTLVFLIDVRSAATVLKTAQGTPVPPKAGLPGIKIGKGGKPRVVLPSGKAPTELVVQPLVLGKGAKIGKGSAITVHYVGVIWPGGKEFDSRWGDKSGVFQIGMGEVLAGWDEGLIGRTVGSRLLMVVPPDKGFGAVGKPEVGIKGTDTLVYVIDILDAA